MIFDIIEFLLGFFGWPWADLLPIIGLVAGLVGVGIYYNCLAERRRRY